MAMYSEIQGMLSPKVPSGTSHNEPSDFYTLLLASFDLGSSFLGSCSTSINCEKTVLTQRYGAVVFASQEQGHLL